QHHRCDAATDDCALADVQNEQRLLVVDRGATPVGHDAGEASAFVRFAGEVFDRVVIDQTVCKAALGATVELVDAALIDGSSGREHDREAGIDEEGRHDDDRVPVAVLATHDGQ